MPATSTTTKTARTTSKSRPKSVRATPDQRRQMIEEAAYFRAEQRAFAGGDPVADWLLSERAVDELLAGSAH